MQWNITLPATFYKNEHEGTEHRAETGALKKPGRDLHSFFICVSYRQLKPPTLSF